MRRSSLLDATKACAAADNSDEERAFVLTVAEILDVSEDILKQIKKVYFETLLT